MLGSSHERDQGAYQSGKYMAHSYSWEREKKTAVTILRLSAGPSLFPILFPHFSFGAGRRKIAGICKEGKKTRGQASGHILALAVVIVATPAFSALLFAHAALRGRAPRASDGK